MVRNIVLVIILLSSSCHSQQVVEEKIKECVKEVMNDGNFLNSFDFYELMEDCENAFIETGILSNATKEAYSSLFEQIKAESRKDLLETINAILSIEDKSGFYFSVYEYHVNLFYRCPYYALVTEKNEIDSTLYWQIEFLKRIMDSSYLDTSLTKQLLSVTRNEDFSKMVYRAPIILLAIINLLNKK
ncbi:MAG: hypothetical protein OIF50_10275 [Flavobacteriaceae bacterium]|nr:hypothetical protein [Flavobacteriaceae bacterium]